MTNFSTSRGERFLSLSDPSISPLDGVVVGNVYNKYHSRNPIVRWLMGRFLRTVVDLYNRANPRTVLEVGCGEGYLADHLIRFGSRPERFEACDLSLEAVSTQVDPLIRFQQASIYQLPYHSGEFELVICCEVLEHLDNPKAGLMELARVAKRFVLLSTPREPVWRILNLARGHYVRALGNTPGHVQNFSRRGLINLARPHLRLVAKRNPLPWTVLLGEPIG